MEHRYVYEGICKRIAPTSITIWPRLWMMGLTASFCLCLTTNNWTSSHCLLLYQALRGPGVGYCWGNILNVIINRSIWETMFESVAFHDIRQSKFATIAIVQQIKLFANLQDVFLCYLSHLLKLVYDELGFTIATNMKNNITNMVSGTEKLGKKNSIKTLKRRVEKKEKKYVQCPRIRNEIFVR